MRLTLRTLLAYRDRVLTHGDLDDMHKRVQQSEMAGKLLQRIDGLCSRPQLLAPKVDGRGLGGDANTVAEYLDDTLHGQQVPELERICLESDIQLAELAQCHQILSSLLHNSEDFPESLYHRVARLMSPQGTGNAGQSKTRSSESINSEQVSSQYDQRPSRSIGDDGKLERIDPPHTARADQSRIDIESQSSNRHDAATTHGRLVGSKAIARAPAVQSPMVASFGQSIRPTGLDLEGAQLAQEVPEYLRGRRTDWRGPLLVTGLTAALVLLAWRLIGPWDIVRQMLASRGQDARETLPEAGGEFTDPTLASNATSNQGDPRIESSEPVAGPSFKGNETPSKSTSSDAQPNDSRPKTAETPNKGNSDDNRGQTTVLDPKPDEPPKSLNAQTAISWLPADAHESRSVVLVAAGKPPNFRRAVSAQPYPVGTELIVPPATRTTVDLSGQVRWTFCGPTIMTFAESAGDKDQVPLVQLTLGRALIASGPQSKIVNLSTRNWLGTIELADKASMVAVEMSYRAIAHGQLTDEQSTQSILTIVAIEGQASIVTVDQQGKQVEKVLLQIGEGLRVIGRAAPTLYKLQQVPPWYREITDRPIDIQAAGDLDRAIAVGENVQGKLAELLKSPRPETRAIATQVLAIVGQWNEMVGKDGLLANPACRSHWSTTLDLVGQLIPADELQAERLKNALVASDPVRGERLFELINGLPSAQVTAEGIEQLVKSLESDQLIERVLAIHNLRKLTGKDLGFQPHDPKKSSVAQWRRELISKRIRIIEPSSALD